MGICTFILSKVSLELKADLLEREQALGDDFTITNPSSRLLKLLIIVQKLTRLQPLIELLSQDYHAATLSVVSLLN